MATGTDVDALTYFEEGGSTYLFYTDSASVGAANELYLIKDGGAPSLFHTTAPLYDISGLAAASAGSAPEPASVFASLGLLTAAGCGLREWRRRKKKA